MSDVTHLDQAIERLKLKLAQKQKATEALRGAPINDWKKQQAIGSYYGVKEALSVVRRIRRKAVSL